MPTASRSGGQSGVTERGTATVEFALVLPLLLVMCLALLQVGLRARDRLLPEAVARAGAREAALQADEAAIRSGSALKQRTRLKGTSNRRTPCHRGPGRPPNADRGAPKPQVRGIFLGLAGDLHQS